MPVPSPTGEPAPTRAPFTPPATPTPTPSPTPVQTPTPTPTTPAIQVTLDYFGIKDTHQPSVYVAPNKIQLYVVADDGKTKIEFSYPFSGEGIPMEYFQLEDLGQQTIFHTSSVGDYLTISVLAYSCADKEATLSLGIALQAFEPSMGPLLDFYEKLPQSKDLIGWYEHTWYATDEWGIKQGKYEAEGEGDLRLWFRIWSNREPTLISKPLFIPEVRIQDVKLPTNAKPGFMQYPITLSLVNSEKFDVPIRWEAVSSITGKFDSGTATVPRNGKLLEIPRSYFWEVGNRTITYTVYYYYNNAKLDTWSGTLNITP
jgi:hypothetical protein